MKQKILNLIIAFVCLPALLLCGCSSKKSKLKTINIATYFENNISCSVRNKTDTTLSISDLTAKEPNVQLANQYLDFEVKSNSVWTYKLYIDYIFFKIYTNMDSSQLTINLSLTNVASEDDLQNPSDDFTQNASIVPTKNGEFNCWFEVKRVIPSAVGTKLTIDIHNSTEVFFDELNNENEFKWMIYDLQIYAESRTYSK